MADTTGSLSIKERLAQERALLCTWMMMPGGLQAREFARAGFGSVLIDMQHGLIGYDAMVDMVQAVNRQGKYSVVRPPLEDFAMVSRALDAGAAGIVFPMVNNGEDAQKLVDVAKLPPVGARSWGGFLGQQLLGMDKQEFLSRGNEYNAVFAMVETAEALQNLDEICAVDGLDGVFVGPNDLCISLTNGQQADVNHELVQEALPTIVATAGRHGKFAGIYTDGATQVKKYSDMGFSFMPGLTDIAVPEAAVKAFEREMGQ